MSKVKGFFIRLVTFPKWYYWAFAIIVANFAIYSWGLYPKAWECWFKDYFEHLVSPSSAAELFREFIALAFLVWVLEGRETAISREHENLAAMKPSFEQAIKSLDRAADMIKAADYRSAFADGFMNSYNVVAGHEAFIAGKFSWFWQQEYSSLAGQFKTTKEFGQRIYDSQEHGSDREQFRTQVEELQRQLQFFLIEMIEKAN